MLEATTTPSNLIPAATVLLLRDGSKGIEVLMLRRNRKLKAFGGAWVFPGGRVDENDGPGLDEIARARSAAIRETEEETGLNITSSKMSTLSNWIPPEAEIRRFSTWFFVAQAPDNPVKIDQGEIHDYQWVRPNEFMQKIPSPDIQIMPPTYISLHQIRHFDTASSAVQGIEACTTEIFKTRFAKHNDGFVTYWEGDCAYEDGNFDKAGPRRRLYAGPDRWEYSS